MYEAAPTRRAGRRVQYDVKNLGRRRRAQLSQHADNYRQAFVKCADGLIRVTYVALLLAGKNKPLLRQAHRLEQFDFPSDPS